MLTTAMQAAWRWGRDREAQRTVCVCFLTKVTIVVRRRINWSTEEIAVELQKSHIWVNNYSTAWNHARNELKSTLRVNTTTQTVTGGG